MHHIRCSCAEVIDLGMYLFVTLLVNFHKCNLGRLTLLLILDKVLIIFLSRRLRWWLGSLCFSCGSLCRCTLSCRGGRGLRWSGWLLCLDIGSGVHLLLLKLEVVQSLSLHVIKDEIVGLLEHGFDLVQALLHRFQVLHHHAKEISLGVLIKRRGVKSILLNDLVEE